jgi:hypothetical protein
MFNRNLRDIEEAQGDIIARLEVLLVSFVSAARHQFPSRRFKVALEMGANRLINLYHRHDSFPLPQRSMGKRL